MIVRRHPDVIGWRPLTDDQLNALQGITWEDDLQDMNDAKLVEDVFSTEVLRHRKWLKHLAGLGLQIIYTESSNATGQKVFSAWLSKKGRPVKRLVCHKNARAIWQSR